MSLPHEKKNKRRREMCLRSVAVKDVLSSSPTQDDIFALSLMLFHVNSNNIINGEREKKRHRGNKKREAFFGSHK